MHVGTNTSTLEFLGCIITFCWLW